MMIIYRDISPHFNCDLSQLQLNGTIIIILNNLAVVSVALINYSANTEYSGSRLNRRRINWIGRNL